MSVKRRRIRLISDSESETEDNDDIVRAHEDLDLSDNNAENENERYQNDNVSQRSMDEGSDNENRFNDTRENENDNDENAEAKKVEPPKKRVVLRKREVLNSERLKGKKGVHTIEKLFEGFKFKGKGHEPEDLNRVMKRIEYWAYRLFPKLDFDDFLNRLEELGSKKDLQVHLKKYRLGMISADDDLSLREDIADDERENQDDHEEHDSNRQDDDVDRMERENEIREQMANERFDALFGNQANDRRTERENQLPEQMEDERLDALFEDDF